MSFPGRAQELFKNDENRRRRRNSNRNGFENDGEEDDSIPMTMRVRTMKDENTTAQKSNNNNNNNNKQLAALFLVALTLENTASMLARRYAVGILQLDFSKNVVLCANEFMKLAFSIFMKYRKMDVRSLKGLKTHVFKRVVKTATPMLVPAFVYLVVNLISYPSLQRVDASVFTAISNLKVLATAIFAQILLDSRISNRVWRTLTQLVLGVTLISW